MSNCGPNSKQTFLQSVAPAVSAGKSSGDGWRAYIISDVGAGGSERDIEKRWLIKHGATGSSYADLWHSYLNGKGIPKGNLGMRRDMFFRTKTAA